MPCRAHSSSSIPHSPPLCSVLCSDPHCSSRGVPLHCLLPSPLLTSSDLLCSTAGAETSLCTTLTSTSQIPVSLETSHSFPSLLLPSQPGSTTGFNSGRKTPLSPKSSKEGRNVMTLQISFGYRQNMN